MDSSKLTGLPVTNHKNLVSQTNVAAVTATSEGGLQQRHLSGARGSAPYYPPASTIMNPVDVSYDYRRTSPWNQPRPYGTSNPYHQVPHAYHVPTQQTHHQTSLSREFTDLSQMAKFESPEIARASNSYHLEPGQIFVEPWTHADIDIVEAPSSYSLPSDTTSLWQSYYPANYPGVSRQLDPTAAQITPSAGNQTFYNHHLVSSMSESDSLIRHHLSGHVHDAGSRRSSAEDSRVSTIHPSSYQLGAHSSSFPVLRPSQADFSVLYAASTELPNRLQMLSETPDIAGNPRMSSYRHSMQVPSIADDVLHRPGSSPTSRISCSNTMQNVLHVLGDESSVSTSSSQRHLSTNDVKPKVTPSTSIGKTRTREKYRTVYTEQQKVELEKEYLKGTFISTQRKADIAKDVGLSERQVKIWFQNRRAKDRKSRRKTGDNCVSTSYGLSSATTLTHSSVHSSDAESLSESVSANAYGGQGIYDFHNRIQQE